MCCSKYSDSHCRSHSSIDRPSFTVHSRLYPSISCVLSFSFVLLAISLHSFLFLVHTSFIRSELFLLLLLLVFFGILFFCYPFFLRLNSYIMQFLTHVLSICAATGNTCEYPHAYTNEQINIHTDIAYCSLCCAQYYGTFGTAVMMLLLLVVVLFSSTSSASSSSFRVCVFFTMYSPRARDNFLLCFMRSLENLICSVSFFFFFFVFFLHSLFVLIHSFRFVLVHALTLLLILRFILSIKISFARFVSERRWCCCIHVQNTANCLYCTLISMEPVVGVFFRGFIVDVCMVRTCMPCVAVHRFSACSLNSLSRFLTLVSLSLCVFYSKIHFYC